MNKVLSLVMLCCSMTTMAQNEQGTFSIKPMAGVNVSTFSGGDASDMYHAKAGFTAGMELEYGINNWLGLSLGVAYSQQGAKVDGSLKAVFTDEEAGKIGEILTDNNGKIRCDYLNLPLLANFHIPAVRGLTLKTGIQLGVLVNDKMDVSTDAVIATIDTPAPFSDDPTTILYDDAGPSVQFVHAESTNSDICKSIDIGIPIGLSYEYKNVVLDVRYCFGLTKIDKTPEPENIRNRTFSVTLGYRINLSK